MLSVNIGPPFNLQEPVPNSVLESLAQKIRRNSPPTMQESFKSLEGRICF